MDENEQNNSEYSLITEKIKDRPMNKKRVAWRILLTVICALIFGVVASAVIAFAAPAMLRFLTPEEEPKPQVVIPRDEYETAAGPEKETETEPESKPAAVTESSVSTEAESETEEETEPEEPETEEDDGEEIPDLTPAELTLEQYQQLQRKFFELGEEANRAIVTVTGVRRGTDWFNQVYSREDKECGLIVAATDEEVIILTDYSTIRDAETITVTFINEAAVEAVLKQYDSATGLAALSIARSLIDDETWEAAQTASLGNSYYISRGTSVLALGSTIGTNYSILNGTITQNSDSIFLVDGVYTVFQTDIVASDSGNGVLTDLTGSVIGYVRKEGGNENTISAISISELKPLVERLSNGLKTPYLGLYISTVTGALAEQYELPIGVYINSVEMDSPAMKANLLGGDVIVEMDGKSISNVIQYRDALLSHEPGDELRIVVERLGGEGYSKVSCTAVAAVKE